MERAGLVIDLPPKPPALHQKKFRDELFSRTLRARDATNGYGTQSDFTSIAGRTRYRSARSFAMLPRRGDETKNTF